MGYITKADDFFALLTHPRIFRRRIFDVFMEYIVVEDFHNGNDDFLTLFSRIFLIFSQYIGTSKYLVIFYDVVGIFMILNWLRNSPLIPVFTRLYKSFSLKSGQVQTYSE